MSKDTRLVDEFESMVRRCKSTGKEPDERFYAIGTKVDTLRCETATRLWKGFDYLQENPNNEDAENLWIELLQMYERACDLLEEGAKLITVNPAIKIFDGEEVYDT